MPTSRFRMAQLELLPLQSGAGAGNGIEPALLALSDFAARQVSQWTRRANGQSSAAIRAATRKDPRQVGAVAPRPLDPCGFSRRSARRQRIGGADAAKFPAASSAGFDNHRYGADARAQTLWRRKCVLLSHGLCLRDSAIPSSFATRVSRARRN